MTSVIAHVTDTHFGGPADARARAERVLAHLLAIDPRPDVLLVTGDIAGDEQYVGARVEREEVRQHPFGAGPRVGRAAEVGVRDVGDH